MPTARPARPVLLVLAAGAALLLGGCGGAPPTAATADATATSGQGVTPPSPPSSPQAAPDSAGTWTSDVRLAGPVSDGDVVVGTASGGAEAPDSAVALDARTGETRWSVPLDGQADRPTLLLAPGRPLVLSRQQDTPGSGLTPASSAWQVVRLDPATGRALWTAAATGPAVAAGPDAVLVEVREGTQTAARGTVALDPADGRELWTSGAAPVLLEAGTAVLTARDAGLDTLLSGVDAASGTTRWSSGTWTAGSVGSRSTALAAAAGRLIAATTTGTLTDTTTVLRVRDLATGEPVGGELPTPRIPAAVVDTSNAVAVVHEQQEQGADTGVYAVDMTTGTVLWKLDAAQSTAAFAAGGGVAWIEGADGIVAVDDRTGTVREQGLASPPALVLDDAQLVDDGPGLRSAPLP